MMETYCMYLLHIELLINSRLPRGGSSAWSLPVLPVFAWGFLWVIWFSPTVKTHAVSLTGDW